MVSDGVKTANATLTIHIQDTNDNTPLFLDQPYEFHLLENTILATYIGTVSANDLDSGANGQV